MSDPARSTPGAPDARDAARWSLLIFAVAFAVRLIELLEISAEPISLIRMGDGRVYHLWARQIAEGDWVGDQVFYQAPLYPYFLAVIYRVAGDALLLVRGVQIVLGATACALLTQAGWRLFGKPVGILAGFGLALYAPALFADVMIQKSVLDLFFVCVLLAVFAEIDARPTPRMRSALGLGVTLGALVLTRENTLVFVAVLLPWLLALPKRPQRVRLALAGLFVAGLAAVLLPVAARNWVVGGDFHLTTSQFGHNFFIGNNPAADGTYAPLVYARGDPLVERDDARELAARALGHTPSPSEMSSFYTERALDYIRSQPLDWIALLGRKLALALNAVELVDTEDQYTWSEYSWTLWLTGQVFHFGVLAPLACLGAFVTWPARRRIWPLYALTAAYLASLLLFYIFARYRLPIVPIAILLASSGILGTRELVRTRPREVVAAAAACTLGTAVLANWPLLDPDYMRSVTHYNLGNELVEAGNEDLGIDHYEQAIALHADNAVANHNLGVILARNGKLGLAIRRFREALRIEPDYAEAHFNLARVLVDTYEPDQAIESYRRGLAIDPTRPGVHVELGRLLAEQGDRAGAERELEQALALDPGNAEARAALAELRAR